MAQKTPTPYTESGHNRPGDPVVSIIIPVHNCLAMTRDCLASIERHTRISCEIIFIDDASDAETADWLDARKNNDIKLIRNQQRQSYSINNNAGASIARGKYLCLLNNDTLVTPGWLENLYDFALSHPRAGVISNKHLFPDTKTLHHCGMAITSQGLPEHLYPFTDPRAPRANHPRQLQLVTFACVLIPIHVYQDLRGLDESFVNGYEDCDFCLRARKAGWEVWYQPASMIYHHGQSSPGRKKHDQSNFEKFNSKWGDRLERDWDVRIEEDRAYEQEHQTKRSRRSTEDGWHFAVDFSSGSAFTWATAELALHMLEKGADISIEPAFSIDGGLEAKARKLLRPLMRKTPRGGCHVKWSHYWNAFMHKPLSGDVNVEFFCTNYRQRPGAPSDLWMRHVQASRNRLLPIGRFNQWALEDIGVPASRMGVMPLGYAPEIDRLFPDGVEENKSRSDLHLFVITNSHDLERYGSDLLVQACGRAFSKKDPIVLHIKDYGTSSGSRRLTDWVAAQPNFPRVQWHHDFLSRDDLIRLYAGMDLLIAPFRGEGFGMKIIDAMALGIPVMMPAFGGPVEFAPPESFLPIAHHEVPVGPCYDREHHHLSPGAYWCEVDVDDFVRQLRGLLDNQRSTLFKLGRQARDLVHPAYSWSAVADRFMEATLGWKAGRDHKVILRQQPSPLDCSVVIPTKDRGDILTKTLAQYTRQDFPVDRWELLLVNDGGNEQELEQALAPFRSKLPLHVLANLQAPGPAGARNTAIEQAQGRIILITGDDIIPDEKFISAHLDMHRKHPEMETAVLGKTLWSKELETTPFMEYLTGEGGQQFAYDDLKHGELAPYDRFYTSNISVKRMFLAEEENLFHTGFRYAAYEDIELAYRLYLRGMKIRYHEQANGFHHHPMDPVSFVARQQRVGRMLTYLYFVQPSYVPWEHAVYLDAFESIAAEPNIATGFSSMQDASDDYLAAWVSLFQRQLGALPAVRDGSVGAAGSGDTYANWLAKHIGSGWEAINQLALRLGMAEEWAEENKHYRQSARNWAVALAMPTFLKSNRVEPLSGLGGTAPAQASAINLQNMAHFIYHQLHRSAYTRRFLVSMQQSRWYPMLRHKIMSLR